MLEGHVPQVENTKDLGFEKCTKKEKDDPGSSCMKDIKRLLIWSFSTVVVGLWLLHGSALE
jgi:hypothetical protein